MANSRTVIIPSTRAVPLIGDDAIVDALVALLAGAVIREIMGKSRPDAGGNGLSNEAIRKTRNESEGC
jgi:hypothetical protein